MRHNGNLAQSGGGNVSTYGTIFKAASRVFLRTGGGCFPLIWILPSGRQEKYSELTKIRTRRRAAGSTNGTEPVRLVLQHLRESFPLSRGGATPYRFLLIHHNAPPFGGVRHIRN
ncbi:TPA: hypothetical protein AABK65_07100 [Neisseria gonorrhoeae]